MSAPSEPREVYLGWAIDDAETRVGRCILDAMPTKVEYQKTTFELLCRALRAQASHSEE